MAWLSSLKLVLISSGVVALALAMKLSFPVALEFLSSYVPVLCASFKLLLRPPYIYVLINGIIITIVASSRFHDQSPPPPKLRSESGSVSQLSEIPAVYERETVVYELTPAAMVNGSVEPEPEAAAAQEIEAAAQEVEAAAEAEAEAEVEDDGFEDKLAISEWTWTPTKIAVKSDGEIAVANSTWKPTQSAVKSDEGIPAADSTWRPPRSVNKSLDEIDFPEAKPLVSARFPAADSTWRPPRSVNKSLDEIDFPAAKPLVSARFGHRKPLRSSPEAGRPLRVAAKPKRHETLESTWKMITEGRSVPLSRHMKTGENQGRQLISVDSSMLDASMLDTSAMVKSETLKDRSSRRQVPAAAVTSTSTAGLGGGGGKLKKEPSLGQDELNRRVEAFINNFNEEMRLQRQESLNQYEEMVNRGSH